MPTANTAGSRNPLISRRAFLAASAAGAVAPAQPARHDTRLRGLMIDAARLPESPAHYRRIIDFCSEWGFSAILFRLTDDQGCAVRFASHPELITHANALTAKEAAELADYGQRRGVTLIPEVESFGHTRYITRVPRYAEFEDGDPAGKGFGGICPVHPEATRIVSDLYHEAARIFPSLYFHGGCDEVNWGHSERSRQAIADTSRSHVWAGYVNSLGEIAGRLGKEFIIWGDVVIHKEPAILPLLDQRIIVMDWQYYVPDPEPLRRTAQALLDQGRRVMGAPAIISCKWGPRCGEAQLRNIDAFADSYRSLAGPGNLGVVITNWVPSRYLARSLWDTYAYGAMALQRGSADARSAAFPEFVGRFYGAAWDATWSEIFDSYNAITPARPGCAAGWRGPVLPTPWTTDAELHAALAAQVGEIPPFGSLREKLAAVDKGVRRHRADFRSFALSVEYLEHLFWRNTALREQPTPATIQTIAERDRVLVEQLDADWNASRPAASPGKSAALAALGPQDQLLFRMRDAARYSGELARDPSRLRRILAARLPGAIPAAAEAACGF